MFMDTSINEISEDEHSYEQEAEYDSEIVECQSLNEYGHENEIKRDRSTRERNSLRSYSLRLITKSPKLNDS